MYNKLILRNNIVSTINYNDNDNDNSKIRELEKYNFKNEEDNEALKKILNNLQTNYLKIIYGLHSINE